MSHVTHTHRQEECRAHGLAAPMSPHLLAVNVCAVTHSHEGRDSFMSVTWLIHECDMTHSYVWRDSFMSVCRDSFIWGTRLIHVCDMTHSYVWHDIGAKSPISLHKSTSQLTPIFGTCIPLPYHEHTATHQNTLQHTATRLHHTAPPCRVWDSRDSDRRERLLFSAPHESTRPLSPPGSHTGCNTLQHLAGYVTAEIVTGENSFWYLPHTSHQHLDTLALFSFSPPHVPPYLCLSQKSPILPAKKIKITSQLKKFTECTRIPSLRPPPYRDMSQRPYQKDRGEN